MDTARHSGTAYVTGIDGLRAVAVLSVFIFHLNPAWLPGGFVGVDVFFVISGFVVTASVVGLRPASLKEFFAYFYARRLIRIAPALIVCVAASMLLASLFIPRAWLSDTNTQTALAALLGFGNIVLAQHAGGYFSERTEFNPFTHTWSLGVEEQFYLVFPVLFFGWFAARHTGRAGRTVQVFAGLSLISLACCWYVTRTDPARAFYWPHTRFWELGIGVLLYVLHERWTPLLRRFGVRTALAAGGLGLLALSFAIADPERFPFPWALVPVLATAALIAVVYAAPAAALSRMLSLEPMRWMGRLSYSLYLWHWPVFVLMRWTVGLETPMTWFAASVAALVMAMVSYYWVETPIRRARWSVQLSRPRILAGGAGAIALALGTTAVLAKLQPSLSLSVTTDRKAWYPDRAMPDPTVALCATEEVGDSFVDGRTLTFRPRECRRSDRSSRLLVTGDSHAWAYSSMFRSYAATGQEVKVYTTGGCPVLGLQRPLSEASQACQRFTHAALQAMRREAKPGDAVFLPSLRMPRRADQSGTPLERSVPLPGAAAPDDARIVEETVALLAPLVQAGVTVVFEAPKPVLKAPPFRCSDWFNATNPACLGGQWAVSRLELEAERSAVVSRMNRIAARLGGRARVWDPFPLLCPGPVCGGTLASRPLYFDGDHISGFGNLYLFPSFQRFMEPLLDGSTGGRQAGLN